MANTARPISVLLVDDDPGDVLMIEEALGSTGAPRTVYVVNDGEEALAFLRQTGQFSQAPRPDVVLLDLNMPRMDGRQVLAEVKADAKLRSIPIVVLTTSQSPADIVSSYSLHANAYVTKPMNLDDLTEVVHKIDYFFARIAALPTQRPMAD
ncbi:MAG TPA: response regulator [Kineosporiaceae bacterium]|nr:response regulator [Kineosporiaceae bacterium]